VLAQFGVADVARERWYWSLSDVIGPH
jgi:hypothetical protein